MKLTVHPVGEGSKTIALIHGISAEAAIFADLSNRLAVDYGYAVLAVDLAGHGDSPRADRYPLAGFADDLVDSLPLGLDAIIGHSLGARVLLDSVSRLRPGRAIYLDPAFAVSGPVDLADRSNVGEHPDGTAYSIDELTAANPRWGPANWARAQQAHAHWDSRMFEEVMLDVASASPPDEPSEVPSMILRAERSPLVSDDLAERLRSLGWEVRTQASAGHNLHLDDVDDTLSCLNGWI